MVFPTPKYSFQFYKQILVFGEWKGVVVFITSCCSGSSQFESQLRRNFLQEFFIGLFYFKNTQYFCCLPSSISSMHFKKNLIGNTTIQYHMSHLWIGHHLSDQKVDELPIKTWLFTMHIPAQYVSRKLISKKKTNIFRSPSWKDPHFFKLYL